jgi:virginiamycin B lyase
MKRVILICVVAACVAAAVRPAAAPARRCHVVVKKQHGVKKHVRVCRKRTPVPAPPAPPAAGEIVASIPVSKPANIDVGEGGVWVKSLSGPTIRIDPATNAVAATFQTPCFGDCAWMGVGDGSVWISNEYSEPNAGSSVSRLDPRTGALVAKILVGEDPERIVATEGGVWVANHHDGSVTRIDPATNRVVATVQLQPPQDGGPQFVAAGAGSIWVGVANDGHVRRINPATNTVVASIAVAGACGDISAQPSAVWVTGCSNMVTHIDPATNQDVARIDVGHQTFGVVQAFGSVWVAARDGVLVRIDPATNTVVGILKFGQGLSGSIAVGYGSLWLSENGDDKVVRVQPAP